MSARRSAFPISVAVLALAGALAGCASGGGSAGDTAGDVEELKRRVVELQRRAAIADVEIARLRQALTDLQGQPRSGTVPGGTGASSAPAPAAPSPAPPPPPPRPPQIDERDLAMTSIPPSPPAVEESTPITPEAQAAYDQAYTLYHQGRFVDAETAFRRYLQSWPGTDLADNASYWIGECRYSRGDLRAALAAFQEAVQRFPTGNKTPDALYKAGQCLEGLGDVESARQSYNAVVERFPAEPAADLARQRLRAIG